jgi:HSP20 family protein
MKENPMSAVRESTTNGGKKAAEVARRPQGEAASLAGHPLAMMRRFAEEADRLFEDFGVGMRLHFPGFLSRGHELLRRETGLVSAEWSPRVDVIEREGKLMIRADLPGLAKDDVKVEVTDDLITIRGERRAEKKEEREGCLYSECSYGTFYRAIPLPEGIDTSKATAEFHNGVLEVTVLAPTRSKPQPRRLEVHQKK